MAPTGYQEIEDSLRRLYVADPRRWLVGYSGGSSSCHAEPVEPSLTRRRCCVRQPSLSSSFCGNSRFGCWTCTVVERDKASDGLLAAAAAIPILN